MVGIKSQPRCTFANIKINAGVKNCKHSFIIQMINKNLLVFSCHQNGNMEVRVFHWEFTETMALESEKFILKNNKDFWSRKKPLKMSVGTRSSWLIPST